MTRFLGVDYGTKRVGLALSDGLGITARPLEVVKRSDAVDRIKAVTNEYEVSVVVIGMPTGLSGGEGVSAAGARELGAELSDTLGVTVKYLDERFTSRIAESSLLESGMRRRERRATVDKVAAAIILQDYLDSRSR
ncbi:MAG: Holliday junction resolvase RuvX [Actinomycetota bacterium]|nr:Holliday junction resolvase RuvX [Actinomycetota bacterium]